MSTTPNPFENELSRRGLALRRARPRVLQINVGKVCNLTCVHCHVNAGPARKEIMRRDTVDRVLAWQERARLPVVDLTGGAPDTINVSWLGEVFDCDFHQMMELPVTDATGRPSYLWDIDPATLDGRAIRTASHCFGCTAGAGSSCGGAIEKSTVPVAV